MKIARLAILGIAVVAAGGAALMASNLTQTPEPQSIAEQPVAQINVSEVLVAGNDIGLGTKLNSSMVRWQKWPEEVISDGYIKKSDGKSLEEAIAGSIVRSAFFEGEPIRNGKLIKSDSGYMSAMLPSGQRAIATSIATDTSAGGFILPNDRVDVIMTRREQSDDGENFITETILQNIRVLAIDQTIEEKDGESVVQGSTATLQLNPLQTEILTVAQQMADRLTLSLRSLEDNNEKNLKNADHLINGNRNGKVRMIRFGRVQDTKSGK